MASQRRIEVVASSRTRPWEGTAGGRLLAAVIAVTDPGRQRSAEGFARFLVEEQPALWVYSTILAQQFQSLTRQLDPLPDNG